MSKKLILFPFGGNARESLLSVLAINASGKKWDVLGFIDDDLSLRGKSSCGAEVLGDRKVLKKYPGACLLAVPGNPDNYLKRKELIDGLGIKESLFATIIHPSVSVSPDAKIGHNTVIMPNVVISCGVRIGNHCVILPNTVISHESRVGDFCMIGSNVSVSGSTSIGPECYIGSGTKIRDRVSVGRRSLVGLGSNVVSDIGEGVVVAGNPARVMRKVKTG